MNLKQLKLLDVERKKQANPIMAKDHPHAITPYPYKQNSANSLTRCIVDYINFTGHFAVRINNGGTFRKGKTFKNVLGGTVKMKDTYTFNGTKGVADIDAMKNGRKVAIEVKYGKDRMSQAQIEMKERIERSGGIYLVAKTFEQFCEEWEKI